MALESVLEQNNWVSTGIKFEIPAKFHQKLVFFQLFWLKIHIFSSHTMNFDIKFQPHENVIFRFSILLLLLISLPNWVMVRRSPNGQSASVISPPPNPQGFHQIDLYLRRTKSRELDQYHLMPEYLMQLIVEGGNECPYVEDVGAPKNYFTD